ncbi:MAG TPA: DUF6078 family protein [Alloprevotella sp.]|nr:DUF6078 family protein [Alloprevotella sp.]
MIKEANKIPGDFAYCFAASCPQAETCLHYFAGKKTDPRREVLHCVNPAYIATAPAGQCPAYREAIKVRMARGYLNSLKTVPAGNIKSVAEEIKSKYGFGFYYRTRKGTYLLPPDIQKDIADILTRHGAMDPVEFDCYEECYNWD